MELKDKLVGIIGAAQVDDSPATLAAYSRDHSLVDCQGLADAVVWPEDAEQVQKVIQLANELKIPVIPVSSEQHFHGSTLPKMGGIIMDLRRMNRILDVDLPDRLFRIEPGVTWAQAQAETEKLGQRMIMPLLPLASGSVIASLLEREPPTNPRF
ncbi:MAG: FAD-binding oxidoreductase, partial [Desulfarculus sp.]|nr:FAD-binding oxidoreductase [Desulfarculus sp.]